MQIGIICDEAVVGSQLMSILRNASLHHGYDGVLGNIAGTDEWPGAWELADVFFVVLPDDRRLAVQLVSEMVARAHSENAQKVMIAVGPDETRLVLQLTRAGARDYVVRTEMESDVNEVLRQVRCDSRQTQPGRVISLLGASGGCGTSTIATNLAVQLAHGSSRSMLLDLNEGRSIDDTLLDIKPQYNLADYCVCSDQMDRDLFLKMLMRHSSGVHFMAVPDLVHGAGEVTPEDVKEVIHRGQGLFPFVVVDVGSYCRKEQVMALQESHLILLVTRMEFASIRTVRHVLQALGYFDIPVERVMLVGSRCGLPREVSREQAEEALEVTFAQMVADDPKTVIGAANDGVPLVIQSPRSRVARSICELAALVADQAPEAESRTSISRNPSNLPALLPR